MKPTDTLVFHATTEVPAVPLEWLWEPYLARGTLAILDGDPGVGKSYLSLDLAARITTGQPMPTSSTAAAPARVLVVSAEDSIEDVILPRFRAAGGAVERLSFFGGLSRTGVVDRVAVFPIDFALFSRQLRQDAPAFVILDPFASLFPTTVSDSMIATALQALSRLATRLRICFLLIRHLNKSSGGKSLYRGRGSIGLTAGVRTVLLAGAHPSESGRSVLSVVKSNLAQPGRSIGYHIEERDGGDVLVWDGPTNLTADDLCRGIATEEKSTDRLETWLYELLRKGPVPAATVEAAAEAAGISFRMLQAVKARLKVDSRRAGKGWEWVWREDQLPPLGPIF